jgi:RNA polymerase sigma-70 factor (ECF subfamily)
VTEPEPGPSPDRIVLMQALATLPLPLRRAVIMYYLGDMSVAEIAALEGTTVNAIKQRLHRGRAALAEHLVEPRPEVGNA